MRTKNKALILAEYFRDFIESRESVKRPGTVKGYIQSFILYARFLEQEHNVDENSLSFSDFNYKYFTEWLQWLLQKRKNDPASCNLRRSQILAFFKWLKSNHPEYKYIYTELNDVETLTVEDKTEAVSAISEKGIKALMAAPGTNCLTGLKYTALMSFQYGTATRTDEVFSIKVGELNINCPKPNVLVTGKGRRKRVVNIPEQTVKILKKYIKVFHGENFDPDAYLFYSPNKDRYSKLSESGYNKQMDKYSKEAHVTSGGECPPHVHPHQLRHSWATHALDHEINIFQISKILGHKSVDTTMRYLGVTNYLKTQALQKSESFVAKNTKVNWKRTKGLERLFK